MNVIKAIRDKHSLSYLRAKIPVTGASWRLWELNPASISFKNLQRLHWEGFITEIELEDLYKQRNTYLKAIKGRRGQHLTHTGRKRRKAGSA